MDSKAIISSATEVVLAHGAQVYEQLAGVPAAALKELRDHAEDVRREDSSPGRRLGAAIVEAAAEARMQENKK